MFIIDTQDTEPEYIRTELNLNWTPLRLSPARPRTTVGTVGK